MDGHKITQEVLSYRLKDEGSRLDLELFIDGELAQHTRAVAGFLSLDQRLGEYDVATGLGRIEFFPGRPSDALPISRLAADFDRRRPAPQDSAVFGPPF